MGILKGMLIKRGYSCKFTVNYCDSCSMLHAACTAALGHMLHEYVQNSSLSLSLSFVNFYGKYLQHV